MKWRAGAASAVVALLVALPLAGWHARVATEARVDDVALAYASGIKAAMLDGLDLQTFDRRPEVSIRVVRGPGDSDVTIASQAVYVPPQGADLLVHDFFGLPVFELDSDG